ncbi:MAG: GerMN domain-containing protein [Spirochaetaceae bacterium]|jgi:spore germination protein GerM|nr:GerMN domain-containing protein [Spirochaetaceae bacterium]
MALRRKDPKKNNNKIPMGILFWISFFVVITALFAINLPFIKKNISITHFTDRLFNRNTASTEDEITNSDLPAPGEQLQPPPPSGGTVTVIPEVPVSSAAEDTQSTNETQAEVQAETPAQETSTQKAADDATAIVIPPKTQSSPNQPQAQLVQRIVYFVKIDGAGMVFTSPVKRNLPTSDSPMLDSLNVLLEGPTSQEEQQGLTTLIPGGTRILSARISGKTAIINFNESFMFNNYGAEGYIAQLRQIVWTASEFQNIDDVQILIDGRRVDYLGESINISRPISRNSL